LDGRTLKTGVLFRSDDPFRLSVLDRTKLRDFGIQLVCDLRTPGQSRKRPSRMAPPIRVVNISLHDEEKFDLKRAQLLGFLFGEAGGNRFRDFIRAYYRHIVFDRTAQVREVITLLAQEGNLPALIHCTAGKDRTGFIVALIQLMCGVPYEAVRADYLRTNDAFAPSVARAAKTVRRLTLYRVTEERIRTVLMAHPDHLDEVHEEILRRYSSVEKYLTEACGIESTAIERLKERLLV
jgi:protein-tyrosine phosphatase